MNNICPYCKADFGKQITRKVVCKNCGKTVFVRSGKTVTEREKEILDWQRYMDFFVPDITKIRQAVEKDLTKRFGKEPSSGDLVWGMFNYIVSKLKEPRDLSSLYENMATFLETEGKSKEADGLKRQALKMTIADYKSSDWTDEIKIKNHNDDFVCEQCKKHNGKIMTLDEAFKEPPVPIETCSNKKCRCSVEFISKYSEESNSRDSNEIVITIKKENNTLGSLVKKLFRG
jgi:predicted nucleic acid-binding protein/DNA-directed RNA polymerase subunit RPC12/RpoP